VEIVIKKLPGSPIKAVAGEVGSVQERHDHRLVYKCLIVNGEF